MIYSSLRDWWKRDDVRDCLQYFYEILADASRFIIVGKRMGEFRTVEKNIKVVFNRFSPVRYIGFSICGWKNTSAVLEKPPSCVDVEMDLDNFPYAFNDARKLAKWCDDKGLNYLMYFTGSRGVRLCVGKTKMKQSDVRYWLAQLGGMLKIWSLDIWPYGGWDRWFQTPGTIHRKSGLPLFVMDHVPSSFTDAFSRAIEILKCKKLTVPKLQPQNLNGDKFLGAVKSKFKALAEKDKKRVRQLAKRFIIRKVYRVGYKPGY